MTTIEQQKWFHRKYEASFGNLTPAQLPPIDWANKEHIEALFPEYKREQLKLERTKGAKKSSKTIEIEGLELWTPTKDKLLFKNTDLIIEPQKRCAVYGENGTGKTMLFHNIVTGQIKGFPKDVSCHHMQEMSMDPEADKVSVMETVTSSHPLRRILLVQEEVLTGLVKEGGEKKEAYEANLGYVQMLMKQLDGYTAEERAGKMLTVLGFDEVGMAAPMSSLSGGLRMRVALASAFFINPEVLLLDEPTNHLDLPSVLWLENKLRGYSGSFLLVTHDRHLLENVVTSVMRLEELKIVPFKMGFAEFEKERARLDKEKEKMVDKFLQRNRNIDPMSPAYRQKLMYQEWQTKRAQRQVAMQGKFTFQKPKDLPNPTGCDPKDISLIKVEDVRFSYNVEKGLPFIFDNPISWEVTMSTRTGIMGPNGAGKSTLLKLITQKIFPVEGKITVNPDFVLAYFGQHSTKELAMDETPFEFMKRSFPKANIGDIKSHLERTSVDSTAMEKRMEGLSFSQRSCVIFAKLTFVPPHLLIMDEPTNFLDLDSVDALILGANKFAAAGGALITVTHNRDFLKRCSKKFLSITPGAFLSYDTMKDAERATYSFIEALERGEQVDHKAAIQDNRGGGAIHTEEYLAEKEAHRTKLEARKARALKKKEEALAEQKKVEEMREAKKAERIAKQKTDWAVGDDAWAPVPTVEGGKKVTVWTLCKVVRNVRALGVTLEVPGGSKPILLDAKKLKTENPEGVKGNKPTPAAKKTEAAAKASAGGRGGRGGKRAESAPGARGRGSMRGGRSAARA